jgi:hypothetical protein
MWVFVEPGVDVSGMRSRDFLPNLSFRIVHLRPGCDAACDLVAEVDAGVEASAPIPVQVQAGLQFRLCQTGTCLADRSGFGTVFPIWNGGMVVLHVFQDARILLARILQAI